MRTETKTEIKFALEVGSADGGRWQHYGTWYPENLSEGQMEAARIAGLPGRRTRMIKKTITTVTEIPE